MFIVVDGIDGSGKGTIVEVWKKELLKRKAKIFDLRKWQKKEKTLPCFEDLKIFDCLISAEPTFAWVGAAIRQELAREGTNYSGLSIAQAYALDREVLYRRVLIPVMKAGKIILQERSFSTSLVYQTIQKNKASLQEVKDLPGNELALKFAPDFLVIADLPAEIALDRLAKRSHKKDNSLFENLTFQTKARQVFISDWYKKFFKKAGTKMIYVNTSGSLRQTIEKSKKLFNDLKIK